MLRNQHQFFLSVSTDSFLHLPQPDAVTQPQIHSTDARGTDGDAEALDPAEQEAVKPSPPAATGPGRIRYRTPSSPDLLLHADADARMRRYSALPGGRPETLADRVHRYRGVLLVVLAPLALVSLVLLLMPRSPAASAGGRRWGPMGGEAEEPSQRWHGSGRPGGVPVLPLPLVTRKKRTGRRGAGVKSAAARGRAEQRSFVEQREPSEEERGGWPWPWELLRWRRHLKVPACVAGAQTHLGAPPP